MKVYRTKSGFCYKELKSGKKKRISKDEYLKLSKSKQTKKSSPKQTTSKIYRTKNGYFYKELKNGKKKRISKENYLKMTKKKSTKAKPAKKKGKIQKPKTYMNYFKMTGGSTYNVDYLGKGWKLKTYRGEDKLVGPENKVIQIVNEHDTPCKLLKKEPGYGIFSSTKGEPGLMNMTNKIKNTKDAIASEEGKKHLMNLYTKFSPNNHTSLVGKNPHSKMVNVNVNFELQPNNFEKFFNDNHEFLGQGSFGTVSRYTMKKKNNNKGLKEGNKVAIKQVTIRTYRDNNGSLQNDKNDIKDCENEIAILKKINHPNIIKLYYVISKENNRPIYYYYVFEYISDTNLRTIIESERSLNNDEYLSNEELLILNSTNKMEVQDKMKIALDIANGLKYLYDKNILHRDLKPANIMVDKENTTAKLIDFGAAIEARKVMFEQGDYIVTTYDYAAPEVLAYKSYTDKSDVWSFAIIISELLMGNHPYGEFINNIRGRKKEEFLKMLSEHLKEMCKEEDFANLVFAHNKTNTYSEDVLVLLREMFKCREEKRCNIDLVLESINNLLSKYSDNNGRGRPSRPHRPKSFETRKGVLSSSDASSSRGIPSQLSKHRTRRDKPPPPPPPRGRPSPPPKNNQSSDASSSDASSSRASSSGASSSDASSSGASSSGASSSDASSSGASSSIDSSSSRGNPPQLSKHPSRRGKPSLPPRGRASRFPKKNQSSSDSSGSDDSSSSDASSSVASSSVSSSRGSSNRSLSPPRTRSKRRGKPPPPPKGRRR